MAITGQRSEASLSRTLFNLQPLCSGHVEWYAEGQKMIKYGRNKVNCIRFSVGMVITANYTKVLLQSVITKLQEDMNKYGIKMNVRKHKI